MLKKGATLIPSHEMALIMFVELNYVCGFEEISNVLTTTRNVALIMYKYHYSVEEKCNSNTLAQNVTLTMFTVLKLNIIINTLT